MKLFLEWGMDWGYFPETANSLFIADLPTKEAAERREFEVKGLQFKSLMEFGTWGPIWGPRKRWRHVCGPMLSCEITRFAS